MLETIELAFLLTLWNNNNSRKTIQKLKFQYLSKMMLAHKQGGSQCGSLSKIVDTPVNGRPSLFGIYSVHQIGTSLSHALLVY
jgi:hypothetical protein